MRVCHACDVCNVAFAVVGVGIVVDGVSCGGFIGKFDKLSCKVVGAGFFAAVCPFCFCEISVVIVGVEGLFSLRVCHSFDCAVFIVGVADNFSAGVGNAYSVSKLVVGVFDGVAVVVIRIDVISGNS